MCFLSPVKHGVCTKDKTFGREREAGMGTEETKEEEEETKKTRRSRRKKVARVYFARKG